MSATLGTTAIRTAASAPLRPTLIQPRTPRSMVAAQSMPETKEVPSREISPKELREAGPLRFQEIKPQEVSPPEPKPLEPPEPQTLAARSIETLKPSESRPREPKDFEAEPLRQLELTPLDPRELKPRMRFEEMFFKPQEYRPVETFARADLAPVEMKAPREGWARLQEIDTPEVKLTGEAFPRNGTISILDLPDWETYRHSPRVQEVDPNLAASYKNRDRVIHTYDHDPMSHWHYHYVPVPVDDVAPPRNRNVVLPRLGVVVDRSA